MKKLLYGAAYYDEYMPYDRLQQDVAMMKKAVISLPRIFMKYLSFSTD